MIRVGLIPARSGSERLPGKNTLDLGGKPLIAWTIQAAQESAMFTRIICSTDDHGIAAVATAYGCEFLERPKDLAQADSSSLSVVNHLRSQVFADEICLLQPTSPFRSAEDIINACEVMAKCDADAVVSVCEAPADAVFEIGHADRLRPPNHSTVVCNGAIYLIDCEHLLNKGDWYNGISYAYRMPKSRSLDVDTKADLERARKLLAEKTVLA